MGFKSCYGCGGSGSYLGSESVFDPSGGYMYKTVQVRKTCNMCGGTGQTYDAASDISYSSGSSSGGRAARTPSRPSTPEEADRGFANLLAMIAGGAAAWYVFFTPFAAETWVKWAVVVAATIVTGLLFHKLRWLTRGLRYLTILAIAGAALGGVLYVVAGSQGAG